MPYDSTRDTLEHKAMVGWLLDDIAKQLHQRGLHHDESKLRPAEKEVFDQFRPKLDALDIESEDYKAALRQMGDALKHHYAVNRHHPEHFPGGVNDMTLVDVIEMVCDWTAAAKRKDLKAKVNMRWARERFGIDDQLSRIIENTIASLSL